MLFRSIEQPLHRRVNTGFLEYASYVIRDRAIPALTGGLKPVQRRILYAMYKEGITSDKRYSKCAGVVGEVISLPSAWALVTQRLRTICATPLRHLLVLPASTVRSRPRSPGAARAIAPKSHKQSPKV